MENRTKRALRACKTKDCMACPAARQCKRGLFNIFEAAEREIDRLEQAEAERVEQSALQAEVQAARAEYEKQLAWLRGQALEAEQKARGYLACEIQSNASVLVTRAIPMEILSDLYSTAFITETEAVEVLAPVGEEKSRYDIPLEECIRPDYPAIRIADCSFISELSEWHACEETLRGFVCVRVLYETTTGALCGVNKRMNVECMLDAPMGQCDRAEICCGDMKAVCEENGEISAW